MQITQQLHRHTLDGPRRPQTAGSRLASSSCCSRRGSRLAAADASVVLVLDIVHVEEEGPKVMLLDHHVDGVALVQLHQLPREDGRRHLLRVGVGVRVRVRVRFRFRVRVGVRVRVRVRVRVGVRVGVRVRG